MCLLLLPMCLGWGVVGADWGGPGTLKLRRGLPLLLPNVLLPSPLTWELQIIPKHIIK